MINLDRAYKNTIIRFNKEGYGALILHGELLDWLGIHIIENDFQDKTKPQFEYSDDFFWAMDNLNTKLALENTIYLSGSSDLESFVLRIPMEIERRRAILCATSNPFSKNMH